MGRLPRSSNLLVLAGFVAFLVAAPLTRSARASIVEAEVDRLGDIQSVDALLALGLNGQAERLLRADIASGGQPSRVALLRLLLQGRRISEATDLVETWADSLSGEGALFLVARIHEAAEDWDAAALAYAESAAREPLLADHAAYRAGLAYQEARRTDEALNQFETAGAAARSRSLSARAYWSAAGLASATGNSERALENLERIPSRSVIARQDLLELEVQIYRAQDQRGRELRVLREMFDRVPSSEEAVAAIRRIEELQELTADDRLAFAESALKNRYGPLAEAQASLALEALDDVDDPIRKGRAWLTIGKALIRQGQLTRARDQLSRMPSGADPEDRAEAALDRARCLWKLGQLDACLAEYDAIVDGDYPKEHRATAQWEAGREAKDNRRWAEASVRLAEFQREHPKHDYADDAVWHGGRSAAEAGDSTGALAAFHRLQQEYPDSPYVEEAGYWNANLHRAQGDSAAACQEVTQLLVDHPDSYWTQRARETFGDAVCPADSLLATRPGADLQDWLSSRFPGEYSETGPAATETITTSAPFRRGRLLAAVGLLTDAEQELDNLRLSLEKDPSALLAFAHSAWRAGVTRSGMRAITILRARAGLPILSGETPTEVARLLYPIDHLDSVLRWSEEYDLDPLFVFAVMREESWFDAGAISWVGARGLLQIMPSTGRDLARRTGLSGYDRNDLFDPDTNIRLGTFYLSALLKELESEPAMALSAYNAGKRNALRWKKGIDGDFDVDRYVAGITYRETYNYVQKVTRSWAIYRHLYGDLVPRLARIQEEADAAH